MFYPKHFELNKYLYNFLQLKCRLGGLCCCRCCFKWLLDFLLLYSTPLCNCIKNSLYLSECFYSQDSPEDKKLLFTGQVFDTFEDLKTAIKEYEESQFVQLIMRNSKSLKKDPFDTPLSSEVEKN